MTSDPHPNERIEPIILIEPIKAGKTTVGRLLAQRLTCAFISLDQLETRYTQAIGYDEEIASSIGATQGDLARYSYRRGFFDEAVCGFLADHTDKRAILELGGGHPILSCPRHNNKHASIAP